MTARLHHPAGSLASGAYDLDLGPERAGWAYSSLRVLRLAPGGCHPVDTGPDEVLVVPLQGRAAVRCDGEVVDLPGRSGVFAGPCDSAYAPPGAHLEITSPTGGRFALAGARAATGRPFGLVTSGSVPVELRGAGSCSREVHNLCLPGVADCERLLVCEVITPAGNWSSYPPHKHDEDGPDETVLEEIYYFELGAGADGPGVAYQRVYGTAERPIDVLAEVRDGDVVLVPHGWHGPSMAAPGYDLYYLNVMAGPGERAWRVCHDPAHAWVRDTWAGQPVDPRLPLRHEGPEPPT